MSDPFDPVNMAMRNLHNQNLLAAKDARIRQLEDELKEIEELLKDTQENSASFEKSNWANADRIKQLVEHIYDMSKCGQAMTYLLLEVTIECPEERRKRDALINRWDRFKLARDKDMKKNNEWPVDHE